LIELLIAVVELFEAEGRELRRATARLGWGLGLMGLALLLTSVGAGLCLWGLYLFLKAALGPAGAGLMTGLFTLAAALVCAWGASRTTR
jgi:hypothetical protein